jgi:hypothetical protein
MLTEMLSFLVHLISLHDFLCVIFPFYQEDKRQTTDTQNSKTFHSNFLFISYSFSEKSNQRRTDERSNRPKRSQNSKRKQKDDRESPKVDSARVRATHLRKREREREKERNENLEQERWSEICKSCETFRVNLGVEGGWQETNFM